APDGSPPSHPSYTFVPPGGGTAGRGQHATRRVADPPRRLLDRQRVDLVRHHLDTDRCVDTGRVEQPDQPDEVDVALAGDEPPVQAFVDRVGLGLRGRVVELDADDPGAGDGPQRVIVATAAEVVPAVDEDTA